MVNKQVIPFYPILFGIYPVLALAAFNIAQIDFSLIYRALALSFVMAWLLFLALRLVMRNWMKAALLTLLLLILFFTYGHVYNFLRNPANPFLELTRHRILGPVWLGLAGGAIWYTTRKITNLAAVTPALNVMVLVLLVFPAFQIIRSEAKKPTPASPRRGFYFHGLNLIA